MTGPADFTRYLGSEDATGAPAWQLRALLLMRRALGKALSDRQYAKLRVPLCKAEARP